jgi:hypothetical protein
MYAKVLRGHLSGATASWVCGSDGGSTSANRVYMRCGLGRALSCLYAGSSDSGPMLQGSAVVLSRGGVLSSSRFKDHRFKRMR